jgi:hydroxymethylpyrimidine/phosphomethylpyrimidine kinase
MNKLYSYASVMTVAGFDGSGGAGIQADIKTISALGCFATSVLTALPVQNTQGVRSIYPVSPAAVEEQLKAILEDIPPAAIKIGMVHTTELVDVICATLADYPSIPIVFDPVMVATSGHKLIDDDTVAAMTRKLFPRAALVTPNMDEASILAGMEVRTVRDMYIAGVKIVGSGCRAVLLKGGHLEGPGITSLYFDREGHVQAFEFAKIQTDNTHGSGCTLSSAIASYLAAGRTLLEAVEYGQVYTQEAILHGADVRVGKGHGPLNHFFHPQKLIKNELV